MSHAAPGRHRATPPASGRSHDPRLAVVAIVIVGMLLIGALAWWLWSRDPGSAGDGADTISDADSSGEASSASDAPSTASASVVESERIVTVKGANVTVEESSRLIDGATARATPPTSSPPGLRLIDADVVTADGRTTAFDAPVALQRSGSLTIRARYRLTDCPDILPTQWPSPTEFPGATRTYPRLEEPLHTAYAICPDAKSGATALAGLSARVVTADVPTVKLTWQGSAALTITTIGSASGVAVLSVEPGCDGRCAGQVPANGDAQIALQPVDPCPPANDNDLLTFVLGEDDVVAVRIAGLHAVICG